MICKRRLKALITKEFFQIRRDPSTFLICVVLPLLLLFIYGFGVSLDLDHLKIGVVLEDTSPEAQGFCRSLMDSPYFDVKIGRDRHEMYKELVRGHIRGIVIVPAYFTAFRNRVNIEPFTQNIAEGTANTIKNNANLTAFKDISEMRAPIQVIADGSEPNTASFVQNYVRGAFQTWLSIEKISNNAKGFPLVTLEPRYWFNEQLESRNFLIPGSLAIIMALIGTMLTALVVAREWERGTMEALLSTPVTILEIIIGKLVPYFILAWLTMIMCVLVAVFFYNVPFRGSLFPFFIIASCFLFSALGQGLLISTIAKNQFVAGQIAMFTAFLPAFMLSGFIFEISSMPTWIQYITYLLTPRYFVSALQTVFLAGNVWVLFIIDIACILTIGLVLFFIISRISAKRLD